MTVRLPTFGLEHGPSGLCAQRSSTPLNAGATRHQKHDSGQNVRWVRRLKVRVPACSPKWFGVALTMLLLSTLAPVSSAFPRPGSTEFISQVSGVPSPISADGRYVVFVRDPKVFVRDRITGATEKVSVASDGTEADEECASPVISADGRYVAFWSVATNLVPGDTNGTADVFVHDRLTHVTERVSVASDGSQASACFGPAISGDGRYVTFWTDFPNVVAGDTNGAWDVFVHDRVTGVTERVSVSSIGTEANAFSFGPAISADGRYVGFMSAASNLVPGDTNASWDTFIHDRVTGITERVSVAFDGSQSNQNSYTPAISADGRYVAFESGASNLVPGATRGGDVFVRDRLTGTIERVSISSDGGEGDGFSSTPYMSNDGRYVAFYSHASNLVAGDTNGSVDAFVHDRVLGITERISVTNAGGEASTDSYVPAISDDGHYVAFQSYAHLVTGAPDGVFVRDRGGVIGVLSPLTVNAVAGAVSVSGRPTFSGTVISSVDDPTGDGVAGLLGPTPDSDLTGASVIYRPEKGDLLVRLRGVTALPGTFNCTVNTNFVTVCENGGGAPGVFFPRDAYRRTLYGMGFEVDGVSFEVRAWAESTFEVAGQTFVDPAYLGLYRCDPNCTEQTVLQGGRGTAGVEFWISVPLSAIGAPEGAALTAVHAFTALQETDVQPRSAIDDANLPDATIPVRSVSLGIAPVGRPESEVAFNTAATLSAGDFTGTIALPDGYSVWARACLGVVCGPAVPWSPLQVVSVGSRKIHGTAGTFDLDLPLTGNPAIECRSGGANGDHSLVFTFLNALNTVSGITATATTSSGTAPLTILNTGGIGTDAHEWIVNLRGVPDASHVTVALQGIGDSSGGGGDVAVRMDVLRGDVNSTGRTDSGDVTAVRNRTVSIPDQQTFRFDVNTSGRIDAGDVTTTRNATVTVLP